MEKGGREESHEISMVASDSIIIKWITPWRRWWIGRNGRWRKREVPQRRATGSTFPAKRWHRILEEEWDAIYLGRPGLGTFFAYSASLFSNSASFLFIRASCLSRLLRLWIRRLKIVLEETHRFVLLNSFARSISWRFSLAFWRDLYMNGLWMVWSRCVKFVYLLFRSASLALNSASLTGSAFILGILGLAFSYGVYLCKLYLARRAACLSVRVSIVVVCGCEKGARYLHKFTQTRTHSFPIFGSV